MTGQGHDSPGTLLDLDAARARRGRADGTEPWVRTAGAAEHFAVSERTIQRWCRKTEKNPNPMPSRKFGVRMFQIGRCERWLEEQAS